MFQSKISSVARGAGEICLVDRSVAKLVERTQDRDAVRLAIIDLSLGSVDLGIDIPLLHQNFPKAKVLAYGAHVDVDRLSLAQECGADEVLTRGQMERDMVAIIQGT
ncbi:MAG: hypothetical protein ABL921_18310 [Pirellula sp.]